MKKNKITIKQFVCPYGIIKLYTPVNVRKANNDIEIVYNLVTELNKQAKKQQKILNLITKKKIDLFEIVRCADYLSYNYEVVLKERYLTEAEFKLVREYVL